MKAMKSEIKENVQGTNSDGKETGTQINGLEQKEERNIHPDQWEGQRLAARQRGPTAGRELEYRTRYQLAELAAPHLCAENPGGATGD